MTNSLDLLADRVERASEGSRELDVEIFRALGMPLPDRFADMRLSLSYDEEQAAFIYPIGDMQVRYEPAQFTSSVDAALSLVPGDWRVLLEVGPSYSSVEFVRGYGVKRERWILTIERPDDQVALLICAAALRALSRLQEDR